MLKLSWLDDSLQFPDPATALREPDGLLAAGGDLSRQRLLAAYRSGIFPWYGPGEPILWWSPSRRMVLLPDGLHVSRSLRKTLRKGDLTIRYDHDFAGVVRACAAPRAGQKGTWIVPEMQAAYQTLYEEGWAHSVECWLGHELVGGLYGVQLGRMFFGESMFSRRTDASKVAMVYLCAKLQQVGVQLVDCQMETPHLYRMGAQPMQREAFLLRLKHEVEQAAENHWWTQPPPVIPADWPGLGECG